MFKWFAPLLLLAAKPEVLIRLVVGALACAVLFGGVWLASNIALTFDTLKNPYIAAAYGVVLLCFFMVVGMVAWLRLRRLGTSPKAITAKVEVPLPLPTEIVAKRAKELSTKWEAESRRAGANDAMRYRPGLHRQDGADRAACGFDRRGAAGSKRHRPSRRCRAERR